MEDRYDPDKESSKKGHFTPIGLLVPLGFGAVMWFYRFLEQEFGTAVVVVAALIPVAAIIGFIVFIIVTGDSGSNVTGDSGSNVRPEDMPPPIDYDTYMREQEEAEKGPEQEENELSEE